MTIEREDSMRASLCVAMMLLMHQATPPPPTGCRAAEYGQFDFWLGEWEVVNAAGAVAGTNSITKEMQNCLIRERWLGARGVVGTSLNVYTPATRTWHQT